MKCGCTQSISAAGLDSAGSLPKEMRRRKSAIRRFPWKKLACNRDIFPPIGASAVARSKTRNIRELSRPRVSTYAHTIYPTRSACLADSENGKAGTYGRRGELKSTSMTSGSRSAINNTLLGRSVGVSVGWCVSRLVCRWVCQSVGCWLIVVRRRRRRPWASYVRRSLSASYVETVISDICRTK